jgi:TonB-dependent receptor
MRFTSILSLCLLTSTVAFADGTISGKVSDAKTGEGLPGATIVIPAQSQLGTATDGEGKFQLTVPDGVYTIQIKYSGYQTKEISDVKIEKGNIVPVNVAIREEKNRELEGVVVRSTLKRETVNALYITQKNAATVSDGISAEVIKKSPDKSTGEVLKRVSGTTIQDNKFVIVRGLTDRYNTALIDNAFLPSTEPNRKAFSFDIIPASLIDNIIISKSATPDLPGDFAGGVINIMTKEIPDRNFNSFTIGGSYNTVSTFKQFQTGYKTPTDIVGFDNGTRQMPGSMPSSDYFNSHNLNKDENIKYLSMLHNDFSITDRKGLPGMQFQGSLGRLYNLHRSRKLGFTAALTYTHSENTKPNLERIYGNLNVTDQIYNYNTTLGALANFAYTTPKTKIVFKNLYNRIFDDNFLFRQGYDNSSSNYIKYYAFDAIQKSLFKTSVEGTHNITDVQKINWLASYNFVGNNQPDQRKVLYASETPDGVYSANVTSLGRSNNRLFGDLKESIVNGAVNYSTPYKFMYKSTLKVGALGMYRYRDFKNRYVGAILDPNYATDAQNTVRTSPIQDLFSQQYINDGAYQFVDQTSASDQYTATAITKAGYVMTDTRINTRLRFVVGVRMESYDLKVESPALKQINQKINQTWNDLLPSVNGTYSLNEKSNLRASYFRSVARPELREIAPIGYYDYELNMFINGNPNLTRSRIDNFDVRYEVFPRAGEVLSASAFYKRFDKTIENQFYAVGSSSDIKTANYNKAFTAGMEIEIRKNLDFIAAPLKNFNFYANLAYIYSRVNLEGDEKLYLNTAATSRDSRPMSGQSPYVINTSLGYSAFDGKLNLNVLYNRIGQRIYIVGGQGQFADVYEMPRNIVDFQVSYNVSKRSEFRLNIKDLLNSPTRFYYDQNDNKKFDKVDYSVTSIDPTKDYVFQRYKMGTTFSLTYTYRF